MSVPYTTNPLKLANTSLSLVPLSGAIQVHSSQAQLISDVVAVLRDAIPTGLDKLKKSPSLINHIAALLANHSVPSGVQVDLESICVQVMLQLFPEMNNPTDIEWIKTTYQFVLESSKTVKKLSASTRVLGAVGIWIQKKLN